MPRLIARGPNGQERRCRLSADRPVRLGRRPTPVNGGGTLEVAWDTQLSRDHADLRWGEGVLHVERLPAAKNPLYYEGREQSAFTMPLGSHFVIGDTSFALGEDRLTVGAEEQTPLESINYTLADVAQTRYEDADQRLQVLSSLPDVIRNAASDDELFSRLSVLLFAGIPGATALAFVRMVSDETVEVLRSDLRRDIGAELKPSRRLIVEAIVRHQQSVSTRWNAAQPSSTAYTLTEQYNWAFCTPVPGDSCAGWGIYVAGSSNDTGTDLRPEIKFTDLAAKLVGAMRDFRALQSKQAMLGRFFSPVTLPMFSREDREQLLEPRVSEVTVLFCDLRGFSREAENASGDLLELLRRVSRALDVMTRAIHTHRGVIGDFQGDAALAFWGWPVDDAHRALDACRAALAIRQRFVKAAGDPTDTLSGFRCGIGIATGEAVAGRLGTEGQFKIDVFGPVVNMASRLEGITKQLRVPILLDERTAALVEDAPAEGFRLRRLARLRPYGMSVPLTASELIPADGEPELLDADGITLYERALDAFIAGRWSDAYALLHQGPHWDHGKDFLTSHIVRHRREAPPGWDGVINLESK